MKTSQDIQPPPVAIEYAREVRSRLGPHAQQIILFGSQASGDATALTSPPTSATLLQPNGRGKA